MEDARVGGADDLYVALDVLPVEGDILATPADNVLVEAAHSQEVRSGGRNIKDLRFSSEF